MEVRGDNGNDINGLGDNLYSTDGETERRRMIHAPRIPLPWNISFKVAVLFQLSTPFQLYM